MYFLYYSLLNRLFLCNFSQTPAIVPCLRNRRIKMPRNPYKQTDPGLSAFTSNKL
ncbi:hypothetical protein CLOSYM_04809 [[Clostridium] symbiosum ATCC 14940]|uniref:Uncharacterized protein n=1 Tax=[Clostridium] symbiosum ATCC 14940 TaxID=411472 RepID=A0ABC9TQJ8_CLOSY|nr:hypothetical protein CLOSYM_04809 [[Clostridium] symbiosum ATCC 14940]